ncbi:MAG TPA: CoA transferase [Bacillota bacterium]|nr:CoA transferase [Bacillota bacterium]
MSVFQNIKVVELGRVFSGPLCSMVLSDIGAEVVKVERPGTGDESRQFGHQNKQGQSDYFNSLNRNKKSLSLDLKNSEDQKTLIGLIGDADVLVHNWLQSSLDRLGFSYEQMKKVNPRLIYCSISGYGYNSPFRDQPSQDIIAQAISGFLSLTGEAGVVPMRTGIPVVDYATALYAAFAIMAALYEREKTGKGQLVHTSLLETSLAMTSFSSAGYLATGENPERTGNRHPSICPYNTYQTRDGLVTIAVANQGMWERFCDSLQLADLKGHPDYKTNELRLLNQNALEEIIGARMLENKAEEIIHILKGAKVSCGRVNNLEEAFSSKEVEALDMLYPKNPDHDLSADKAKKDSGTGDMAPVVASPFHMDCMGQVDRAVAPSLGQHTDEIKRKLHKPI